MVSAAPGAQLPIILSASRPYVEVTGFRVQTLNIHLAALT